MPAGPVPAEARRLAAASGLTEIDAHAMVVAEPELSDEIGARSARPSVTLDVRPAQPQEIAQVVSL